ncbi:hypothetical protein GLOIN_2v1763409 [Rhizophagus irregularis DAOM 181602=DAOM 197198]|nr:hypothetical protein GLOIN_2v1763409 [Rhizophagus irregularis DAOM 181602=DAOM 197198]
MKTSKFFLIEIISLNQEPQTESDFTCIHPIWFQTPINTNVGESAHANINRDGRDLSLLSGIARRRDFDNRQVTENGTYKN